LNGKNKKNQKSEKLTTQPPLLLRAGFSKAKSGANLKIRPKETIPVKKIY